MQSKLNWAVIVPLLVVAVGLIVLLLLDLTEGGAAKNDEYLGEAKAQKYPYVAPTATPFGGAPTVRPRPTTVTGSVAPSAPGDPAERDAKRRLDLLALMGAADEYKAENGDYASTDGKVQTLCNYVDLDIGCAYKDFLTPLPLDPLGDPTKNGYWYSSDGGTAKFYASLEDSIPDEQKCPTEDVELQKKSVLICVEAR